MRLFDAAQNLAADADLRLERENVGNVEELLGIVRGKLLTQAVAAVRDGADAAPLAVAYLEDFADELLRGQIADLVQYARVLILYDCAPLLQLLDGHQHAFEDVQRFKAGDDDWHFVVRADGEVLAVAHHGADVARPEESLHAVFRRGENCLQRRRHQHVGDQQRNIVQLFLARAPRQHGIGRSGGLKADGKEDDLLRWICPRDFQTVQR